jgi:hypothetical protein
MRNRSNFLGPALSAIFAWGILAGRVEGDGLSAAIDQTPDLAALTQSANAGDVSAMRKLGNLYLLGDAVPKDPTAALSWFSKGAQAGDASSMSGLAVIYLNGDGVPVDLMTARHWARSAADLKDATGEWLYYLTVADGPELDFQVNGTPDIDLYNKLAQRSVEQRALDISAYSALAQALAGGLDQARTSAVHELLDRAAPGNREAALRLIRKPTPLPGSDDMVATLTSEKQTGETLTKPAMYADVLSGAKVAAMTAAKAGPDTPEKLVKTTISRPLAQEVYLPVPEAPFQHFYMLQGNWQETWTFDVGGMQVEIPIEFQADGLGGAYYQAKAAVH